MWYNSTHQLYYILQAISHIPVSAVADIAPDLPLTESEGERDDDQTSPLTSATVAALDRTMEALERAREGVTDENFPNLGQVGC